MKKTVPVLLFLLLSGLSGAQKPTTYDAPAPDSNRLFGTLVTTMPFGAVLYKYDGYSGPDFLKALTTEFAGKSLFLNVWAPWCRPCMEAMSTSKNTRYETRDLPLEYIYICPDFNVSQNRWISTVSAKKLAGLHIYISYDLWRSFLDHIGAYGGFPNYLYFDRTGIFLPGAVPHYTSTTPELLRKLVSSPK